MNPAKQSTLFQTWAKTGKSVVQQSSSSVSYGSPEIVGLCDGDEEEDELLARALEESLLYAHPAGTATSTSSHGGKAVPDSSKPACQPSTSAGEHMELSEDLNIALDSHMFAADFEPSQSLSQIEDIPGFDKVAGKMWIYPTNYPLREYQYNIVSKALYKNTMVTLPTGLGKTFIAAVLMYNFYRWYPQGKVVFMAPTKPLVAQQIEACYNIMGIPQEDTAEMTGTMSPAERLKAWNYKRVFFLTPQVLTNDLSRGACPSVDIKCLVIDEAHKALGNHAYCQVVRELVKYTRNFRILALSATPGSDIKAVQEVVAKLLISQIELRTEESIDIKPYVHDRNVVKIVVPLGKELTAIKEKYIRVMDVIVKRLTRQRVLYNRQTTSLSKFMILKAREAFRQNPPPELQRTQYGAIEGDFALAMSLYHGFELLQLHGLKSLYTYLEGLSSGDKGYGRTRTELNKNGDFRDLMDNLHSKFANTNSDENQTNPFALSQRQTPNHPFVSGHPKIEKLREVVLQHFEKYKGSSSTRIMIFAQYRDSVTEITDMLSRHRPLVKVMSFIGQSSTGKTTKGFTQKEQLKVMKKFREGGYNTLVSTCVGEEGLDIGDVDLIVCFDASKSPIRLVQRMGRTGRKREGSIVMLMTEGKEEQIYNQSQYSKKSIHKAILNGAKSLQFYPHSPCMIPENLKPRCHKMHITVQKAFKSTAKGRAANDANKAQKNSGMFDQPSKKPHKSDGLLTEAELQYWSENFKLPDNQVPKLPESDFRCFKKKNQPQSLPEDDINEDLGPQLRLSEWMPWQNRKHTTHKIDHSLDTEHLVEMMEFIDVQQSLGEDDDSYGMEMAAYLKTEDIVCAEKKTVENVGIRKFSSANNTEDNGVFECKDSKSSRGHVRRSEALFAVLCDLTKSSSDEGLPPFMASFSHSKALDTKMDTNNKGVSPEGMNGDKFKDGESVSILKTSVSPATFKFGEGKLETFTEKCAMNNGLKPSAKVHSTSVKFSKRKKKRESGSSRTVVEIILDDDDDDDFAAPVEDGLRAITEEMPGGLIEEAMEVERLVPDKQQTKSEEEKKVAFDLEMGRLSQLLPDVMSFNKGLNCPDFLHGSYDRSDKPIATPDDLAKQRYRVSIPSPPPIEEIRVAFSKMGSGKSFPELDVVQLVDEWEQEKLEAGLNHSNTRSSRESRLSHRLFDTPVKVRTCASPSRVRALLRCEFDTSDGPYKNLEKNSSGKMDNDENLNDMFDQPLSEGHCFSINEWQPSKSVIPCKKDCFVENDVSSGDIHVLNKCGAKDEFSQCCSDGTENCVDLLTTASHQVDEKTVLSSDLLHDVPPSPWDTTGLKNGKLQTVPDEIGACDSQECSDHSPILEGDPTYTKESKPEASAVCVDQQEMCEDYGEWDFTVSDLEDDVEAEGEEDLPVSEWPKSPVSKPYSLPFERYAEPKSAAVTPVKPVIIKQANDPDFDNCFDQSDLFLPTMNTPVTVSKGSHLKSPDSACKPTPGKTPAAGLDESHFTFTQALACLHDSPAPTHAFRPESLGKSAVNKEPGTDDTLDSKAGISLLSPPSDWGSSDKGDFELGFSWDDVDVVPPSPVHDQSICQKPSKCSQSLVFGKRKFPTMAKEDITASSHCHVDANPDQSELDDVFAIPFEESVVFSKSGATYEPSSRKLSPGSPPSVSKNVRELHGNPRAPSTIFRKVPELPGSPVFTPSAFLSARVAETKTVEQDNSITDDDDDFCVLKRSGRKASIIDSPAVSFTHTDKAQLSPSKPFEFRTPTRPSERIPAMRQNNNSHPKNLISSSESEDSPVVVKRRKFGGVVKSRRLGLSPSEGKDEEDGDFADRPMKMLNSLKKKAPTAKQYKKKRSAAACAFIDHEAELSEDGASDVSDDEVDNSQMDSILQDFIYDGSQLFHASQAEEHVDETAMYLRSVMSPRVKDHDGVYRRDRRPPVMDVYSQIPQEDYSEYLEDSFCVLEDEEEWGTDENDPGEITCFYLPKKRSREKPRKRRDRHTAEQERGVGRKRIVCQADSSSEDDIHQKPDLSLMLTQEFSSKQTKRARIVSSSEEDTRADSRADQEDVNCHHSHGKQEDELSPPLLSLRSRLQAGSNRRQRESSMNLSVIEKNPRVDTRSGCGQSINEISSDGKDLVLSRTNPENCKISCGKSAIETLGSKPGLKKSPDLEREERLRRQREKQEEFRRKMAEKNRSAMSLKGDNSRARVEAICDDKEADNNKTLSVDQEKLDARNSLSENGDSNFTKLLNPSLRIMKSDLPSENFLVTNPSVNRLQEKKIVILVDSREITGGQEVVSCLRVSHQFNVAVRQLSGCDYILSNRLGVERKLWADFANGSHRAKLQERVQEMCTLFDRPCLIIERDKTKPGEEKVARPQVRTKYVDTTLAWLAKSSVQIFFTESQEESAGLLTDLCKLEERKGMAIRANLDLNPYQQQWLNFFTNLPRISYINALNLCHGFKNLTELCNSSIRAIQTKGQLSESKAKAVRDMLQHHFCLTMVPASSMT
ncbi:Fanconi anemia group M protein-like [Liolophura sinensis]|uniref:Fanconi anemia group M protein-like n=1 Tax=Liolophura sinensis TaxID=3198878 RepID=UPI0031596E4C